MTAHFEALEIINWQRRDIVEQQAADDVELSNETTQCLVCALHESDKHALYGIGNANAKIILVGDAPVFGEDRQIEPFTGDAGQLLKAMLKAIDLQLDDVFVMNMFNRALPENHRPVEADIVCCLSCLNRQIALIKPRLIVALGATVAHYLLNKKASLESFRNTFHEYGQAGIPLYVTYHPAYLLQNPADKRYSWEDLKKIKNYLS